MLTLLSWSLVLAACLQLLPQLLRVRRIGSAGVSATSWVLQALTSVVWLCWAVATATVLPVLVVHLVALACAAGILCELGPLPRPLALAGCFAALGILATAPSSR